MKDSYLLAFMYGFGLYTSITLFILGSLWLVNKAYIAFKKYRDPYYYIREYYSDS